MSHHLYKTDALVLGAINTGEAHRFVDFLTRDLGRVRAVARSVREEKSKLRYVLQDFSFINLSLVRGKEVWRVVGAEEQRVVSAGAEYMVEKQELLARLFALLRRFLPGEEKNEPLFDMVAKSTILLKDTELEKEMLENLECLTVFKMLHNLGYIAEDVGEASFLDAEINKKTLKELSPYRFEMIQKINQSLQESQL